jgi:hypothetical protein
MTGENVKHTKQDSQKRTASRTDEYDPFVRGRFPVGVRTIQALDTVRDRRPDGMTASWLTHKTCKYDRVRSR